MQRLCSLAAIIAAGAGLWWPQAITAQATPRYRIEHVVGSGDRGALPDGQAATRYRFEALSDIALGPRGELYLVESRQKRVRRVSADGTLSTMLVPRPSLSIPRVPENLAVDASGDVYVSDSIGGSVRVARARGEVETILGERRTRGFDPNAFVARVLGREIDLDDVRLGHADGIAVVNGTLFIVDGRAGAVWRIQSGGRARVVAGTGASAHDRERRWGQPATQTPLDRPVDVAADAAGNLYVYEQDGTLIHVDPAGTATRVATPAAYGKPRTWTDEFDRSNMHVEMSPGGDALFSDGVAIRRFSLGRVCTVLMAGASQTGASPWCDEPRTIDARHVIGPFAVGSDGTVVFADQPAECVFSVSADTQPSLIAGRDLGRPDVPADDLELLDLTGMAVRPDGTIALSDARGVTLVAAGTATRLPLDADDRNTIDEIGGLAFQADGALLLTDEGNFRVFRRSAGGVMTRLRGISNGRNRGNQEWTSPRGIAVSPRGDVYVADTGNSRIVRITPNGTASIVAGTGNEGHSGDDGPAVRAELNRPFGAFVNARGEMFIADTNNGVIRKVDTKGIVSTLAGGLSAPEAVIEHPAGLLIVADTGNNRVVAIESDGTLRVLAGTGAEGHSGDGGEARAARMNGPCALALEPNGTIYVADCGNVSIRKLVPY